MEHIYPSFWPDFVCLAGECQATCCGGWQIVIDPDTLARYRALEGPLGEQIRAAVEPGEEPVFRQREGRCVLLQPNGLCPIQARLGLEAMCTVCRDYPRFVRHYGLITEHGLSMSCPEALELALGRAPGRISAANQDPVVPNDLDPERYMLLRQAREQALALLAKEALPFSRRAWSVLALAGQVQLALDHPRRGERFGPGTMPPPLPCGWAEICHGSGPGCF